MDTDLITFQIADGNGEDYLNKLCMFVIKLLILSIEALLRYLIVFVHHRVIFEMNIQQLSK